ncbi:MAG: hypothetical protein JO222_06885, partial [Frankiales bacterium]|nr:hypothetical protein [Frankiales bacterium]
MDDLERRGPDPRPNRRRASAAALLAAGAVAGGVLAGTIGASAASGGSTPTPTPTTKTAPGAPAHARSATPVRPDEKAVTGSLATTLKAKALAAVPGGTIFRIESDAG